MLGFAEEWFFRRRRVWFGARKDIRKDGVGWIDPIDGTTNYFRHGLLVYFRRLT